MFEASSRAGGIIRTSKEQGFLFEHGPNSLLLNGGDLGDLISGLNLEDQVVEANSQSKKRFIVRDGKVLSVPLSAGDFFTTPLLSLKAKLRLLAEPFQEKSNQPDESLASFAERRLGREVLEYLLNPFVSGVYAGTPEKLSARYAFPSLWRLEQNYGSLFKGFLKQPGRKNQATKRRLISFRGGIQTLTDALAFDLSDQLRLNTPIGSVRKEESGWMINEEFFDAVISTIPLHQLTPFFPALQIQNLEIPYAPLDIWHLGFDRSAVHHPLDGFGLLIPEIEKFNILGCLFPSTLFPGRAPLNQVLLTVFIGGGRQPELAGLPLEHSLPIVLKDLDRLLGLTGGPLWKKHIRWEQAIPQYTCRHGAFLEDLNTIEQSHPGWHFCGNFRGGVSVPDCITNGRETASAVLEQLASL